MPSFVYLDNSKEPAEEQRRNGFKDIPSAAQVEQILEMPAHALIRKAEVEIFALPADESVIGQVSEVRPNQNLSDEAIIDLKRTRSVSGLKAAEAINSIKTWTGAVFSDNGIDFVSYSGSKKALFSEVSTERLLVKFNDPIDLDELAQKGKIRLPDPPSDLVLTINDKTVWTHIGPVKLAGPDPEEKSDKQKAAVSDKAAKKEVVSSPADELKKRGIEFSKERTDEDTTTPRFTKTVDIAEALQEEIDTGKTTIRIALRGAAAYRLRLTVPTPEYCLIHEVAFPAQALALDISEECRTVISLPLPPASNDWQVEKVALTVEGNTGQSRLYPAVGPSAIPLGELVIDSEHAPAAFPALDDLSLFNRLEAIRLPLVVEEGGSEITAVLRRDSNGDVGDVIDGSAFKSVTLDKSDKEHWVLLELEKPMDLAAEQGLWIEINAIRGRCWWRLGGKNGESAGVVDLKQGVPGGPFRSFTITLNQDLQEFKGRLRLKGQPLIDGAIPAIMLLEPVSHKDLKGVSPGRGLVEVVLEFSDSVIPRSGNLDLPLRIHAPGTYTITAAQVIYQIINQG